MRQILVISAGLLFIAGLGDTGLANEPPYFPECPTLLIVGSGNRLVHDFIGIDLDGDPLEYSIIELSPALSYANFDPVTGRLDIYASYLDIGLHQGTVSVTDGTDTATCTFGLEVVPCGDFEFYIEGNSQSQPPKALPGSMVEIDIMLYYTDEQVDGFNFLFAFDTEYLTFIEAAPGELVNTCEWEYFTYADESVEKNSGNMPSGLARVIAVADTGSDDHHPDPQCFAYSYYGAPVATLRFQIADNPSYQGMRIPVRFYWMSCFDNLVYCYNPTYGKGDLKSGCVTLPGSDSTYICQGIRDYDGTHITDHNYGLPGGFGPPDACYVYGQPLPIPLTELSNGSIYVACPGGGDANGDESLNIGDAVFLIAYIFQGGAAPDPIDSGDANCDNNVNVGDAVYLINHVFKGGPPPCVECP